MGTTLLERIEWIKKHRTVRNTGGEVSRMLGKSRGYVDQLRARLQNDPDFERRVRPDVLEAMAKAAGVSVIWLQHGIGTPDGAGAVREYRYPNLAKTLEREGRRWAEATIAAAEAMTWDKDPSIDGWVELLNAIEKLLVPAYGIVNHLRLTQP